MRVRLRRNSGRLPDRGRSAPSQGGRLERKIPESGVHEKEVCGGPQIRTPMSSRSRTGGTQNHRMREMTKSIRSTLPQPLGDDKRWIEKALSPRNVNEMRQRR